MPNTNNLIGLLGGTFDPIHLGHLNVARKVLSQLHFKQIQFIPCHQSPHRDEPKASPVDRLAMVKLAIEKFPQFSVNDIEIRRPKPSYTIDTLKALKTESPNQTFSFILSSDAFSHFNQWHEWKTILNYCHLVVVNRINFPIPDETWITEFLNQHETKNPEELLEQPNGKVILQEVDSIPITATKIREVIAAGKYPIEMLPLVVIDYVQKHKLYS